MVFKTPEYLHGERHHSTKVLQAGHWRRLIYSPVFSEIFLLSLGQIPSPVRRLERWIVFYIGVIPEFEDILHPTHQILNNPHTKY